MLRLATGAGDLEMALRAPPRITAALAGVAVLLPFRPDGGDLPGTTPTVVLLSHLDDTGTAHFRVPGRGAITGVRIPARRSRGSQQFTPLPALARHAAAAATAEDDGWLRLHVVLDVPPVTVTAYETPDKRLNISVEGLAEPEPDTALLVSSQVANEVRDSWALPLRWSSVLGAVRASLSIGRARAGLEWELNPEPVQLADLPTDLLRRSQAVADEQSGRYIGEILAGRR